MDNQYPASSGDNLTTGLSATSENTSQNHSLYDPSCRRSILLLAVLAVACVALVLSPISLADTFTFAMSFPFSQIGSGLRWLSLSGGLGNAFAIVLYVAVCILPALASFLIRSKRAEDVMLIFISVVLFFVMYYMINPGRLPTLMVGRTPLEQALLGGAVHSLLLAYGVIRILRLFESAVSHKLGRYIGIILHLLNILFVFVVFGHHFAQMLDAFAALEAANTMPGQQLGVTYVFLFLQHLINALPYVLNIWVVFAAWRLIKAISADPYSEEAISAANGMSRVCAVALTMSVFSIAGFNLLQLLFIGSLHTVNTSINFPATSILFVLGALLLARYIAQNKRLKDENDQFV